jgi:hypothetical protein
MESRAIQAAERNRKVDEEFHKTDTSLLIGPFYVFRVGDKKRFDAIQLCTTTTTTAISRDKVQHLLCRYNENGRKKSNSIFTDRRIEIKLKKRGD